MKYYKTAGIIVLLITVSLALFKVYEKDIPYTGTKSDMASNTTSSNRNDEPALDSSMHLSDKDSKKIMQEIDSRVKTVKDKINQNLYEDHYDGDNLMFRYFETGIGQESFTGYSLYYDAQGKLIYADIAHYRGALYSIYFHNDEVLHTKVGPFLEGELSINGDMEDIEAVTKKDSSYSFVTEDISLCLKHAYT